MDPRREEQKTRHPPLLPSGEAPRARRDRSRSSRLGGPTNLPGLTALLESARAGVLDLTYDSYPYNRGSGMLHAQLPDWVHAGGPDKSSDHTSG